MRHLGLFLLILLIGACTPKTTEEVTTDTPPTEEIDYDDPCLTWNKLPNQDAIIEAHVLYRDFLKQGDIEAAYPYWRAAFKGAPMADGNRTTHFEDGMRINHHFYKETGQERYKTMMVDTLMKGMIVCAKEPGLASGRQAFDLYYQYPGLLPDLEVYDLFTRALDEQGEKTPAFVLNPFMKLLTDLHLNGDIDMETAQLYAGKVEQAMNYGLANCGEKCNDWKVVEGYVPSQFDRLESVKGFFDCEYYREKYYAEFKENPTDCDVVDNAFIRMKWGECDLESPEFKEVAQVKATQCKEAPVGDPDLIQGRECLESGDYACAIDAYGRYAAKTEDNDKKAKFILRQAKIAYAHLKNYPKARRYALEAAGYKSGWGEPYMLIGSLYASSGPLCGPGTGWDSQVVTWPAIDKWKYAKSIDSSVSGKANSLINRYEKFMPDIADIFQRGLKEGQTFKVGCWINESTKIRAAR